MNDTIDKPHAAEHVLDEEGHFHVEDAPIDLSHYLSRTGCRSAFFWLLGLCVFYQFFTRYVMNDSAAWTEEIARYLLICTVFVAIAASVRRTRHIHVDFMYRLIPPKAGRALSTLVDVMRIVFFALAVGLTIQMMMRHGQPADDHHRPADEHHLRHLRVRIRRGGRALGPGRDRELAARLQLARTSGARNRGDHRMSGSRR
jgi:ABC-type nickel/cobalt efflux system permease component RcnA